MYMYMYVLYKTSVQLFSFFIFRFKANLTCRVDRIVVTVFGKVMPSYLRHLIVLSPVVNG